MQDCHWNKRNQIALFLKIGIIGAVVILAGDLLMGWGLKDMSKTGLAYQLSQYLTISDRRMFWAAVLGFTGVPLADTSGFTNCSSLIRKNMPGCTPQGF